MYCDILNIEKEICITLKKELGDMEKQIGKAIIPPSYLQFATEMGYGLLMDLFLTYIPFGKDNEICDSLENRNKYWKRIFDEYLAEPMSIFEEPENIELIKNAEPFLKSENGEIVFWDTRKEINGEYAIYLVDFAVGVYHVANDFMGFIKVLTSEQTFKSVLKFSPEPLKPNFKPFGSIG